MKEKDNSWFLSFLMFYRVFSSYLGIYMWHLNMTNIGEKRGNTFLRRTSRRQQPKRRQWKHKQLPQAAPHRWTKHSAWTSRTRTPQACSKPWRDRKWLAMSRQKTLASMFTSFHTILEQLSHSSSTCPIRPNKSITRISRQQNSSTSPRFIKLSRCTSALLWRRGSPDGKQHCHWSAQHAQKQLRTSLDKQNCALERLHQEERWGYSQGAVRRSSTFY